MTPAGALRRYHWRLIGDGEFSYMHTFTDDGVNEGNENFDYMAVSMLVGPRAYFSFGAFSLWAGAGIGTTRLFLHIKEGDVVQNPGAQAVIADLSGGADIPLGQRLGVLVRVGLRAQRDTEPIIFKEGITAQLSPDGSFYGLQGSMQLYARF